MRRIAIKIFISFLLIFSISVKSQTTNHFGIFPTIGHSGTLSDKWDYSLYYFGAFNLFNPANSGKQQAANFFIFYSEQALSYKANKNLSFTGSYVYQRVAPFEDSYVNENRFYLQATYKTNLNRISFKNRLRYDGRFIQDRFTNTYPFTSRVRYLFGVQVPLQKEKNNLYFAGYNEFFFNTFKNSTVVYAENWASAAVGYKTARAGNWELGPLYIFWVMNKQYDLTNLFYLQLTWVTHLDFRKNK